MKINAPTQQFINEHICDDVNLLALHTKASAEIDVPFALEQIAARQRAKEKLPLWYANKQLIFPPAISMEQCSSEATAAYKAELCDGSVLLDLTGGFGVDFSFMSKKFLQAIYVEKNEKLAEIAKHNFEILGLKNTKVICGNSTETLENTNFLDCIYVDPSRRDAQNNKQILLENCSPNIIELKNLLLEKSKIVLIKLSPLFDISALLKTFDEITEIHIVAVQNECKELLVKLEKNRPETDVKIICVNIAKSGRQIFDFMYGDEKKLSYNYVALPQNYVYEPNAAILKSGGFKSLAAKFKLNALNANSKIYVSNELKKDFCGRIFCVEKVIPFKKNEIKTELNGIKKANITVRNFPLSVAELRKRLHLSDGGDIYIFATTLLNGDKVLLKLRKDI